MPEREVGAHAEEVASGKRFAFGKNWRRFLGGLNEERIDAAVASLRQLTGLASLGGKRILDIGSGSGLFSLAAMRLGADAVLSFDYDPDSVRCGLALKEHFFPGDNRWRIVEGSVLDEPFLVALGTFDVVYAWGVLHHTGDLYRAFKNTAALVAPSGLLAIAIYNDQGWKSRAWRVVKAAYCRTPGALRPLLFSPVALLFELKGVAGDMVRGRSPRSRWRSAARGMNPWHDWADWLGGFPFEVATPEAVFGFFRSNGFLLERLTTCMGGYGNNEFTFSRDNRPERPAPGL
jgi:2-polyprenyl-6-hydroxyphenyl methylase/3-demethylubiquinone-9 3-methyltransferase